jgi:hypothetical protein
MSVADELADDRPEPRLPGGGSVRVKLYVHGGTISFAMRWSSSLQELSDHFTRNLQPKRAGMVIATPDRLIQVAYGSVSAYEFSVEPPGGASPTAEVRPA